jgi:hypothetical protein
MHWQNTGQDNGTSSSAKLQVGSGLDRFRLSFVVSSTLRFKLSSAPGRQAMNSPHFANADR